MAHRAQRLRPDPSETPAAPRSPIELARRRLAQRAQAPQIRHLIAAALLMAMAGAAAATSVIFAETRSDRAPLERNVREAVPPAR